MPLPHSYKVPHTTTTLRIGFGDATDLRNIVSLLSVCKYSVMESIIAHGVDGEIDWETRYRQMFEYDPGDGIRITIMNLAGKVVHWGQLQTVLQGLWDFLLDGSHGAEVMFRFRCGAAGEIGWGWIAQGRHKPAVAVD